MAKIQKIKIAANEALDIEDAKATHSINGYESSAIEAQTVTFANQAITTVEINNLFAAKVSNDENKGGNE